MQSICTAMGHFVILQQSKIQIGNPKMKVTAIGIVPPPSAKENPSVTPELLASCLAKYSRSNKGIHHILSTIDWENPDKAVDTIFKFIDYGHASIGGLTGGIAMAIDGASILLVQKIFEIAQLCDGQESSTRYIEISEDLLLDPEEVGIPKELQSEWKATMVECFQTYKTLYARLDEAATKNPKIVRFPSNAGPKVIERMRKNYALDRARYFMPIATRNNGAYIMTARVWAQTIRQLDSLEWPEAKRCAELLRTELGKFAPRLTRHSNVDDASMNQAQQELEYARQRIIANSVPMECLRDEVFVHVDTSTPPFMPNIQSMDQSFANKTSRYSQVGEKIKRSFVRFAWNNIAMAELRDLIRHRSGYRFSPFIPTGFYLPPEIDGAPYKGLLDKVSKLTKKCAQFSDTGAHSYCFLMGTQFAFEHSTHLDKLIYEIELRTGLGAHFRYAEHLEAVAKRLVEIMPELGRHIEIGTAEPE